jgi:hypothetical protein
MGLGKLSKRARHLVPNLSLAELVDLQSRLVEEEVSNTESEKGATK